MLAFCYHREPDATPVLGQIYRSELLTAEHAPKAQRDRPASALHALLRIGGDAFKVACVEQPLDDFTSLAPPRHGPEGWEARPLARIELVG